LSSEFGTGIERIKNKQLHLVDNENKNQQIECGTPVIAVGKPPDCQLFTETCQNAPWPAKGMISLRQWRRPGLPRGASLVSTNDGFINIRRNGDCPNQHNVQETIWDAYEFMRRL
jgi:hypothetical protein